MVNNPTESPGGPAAPPNPVVEGVTDQPRAEDEKGAESSAEVAVQEGGPGGYACGPWSSITGSVSEVEVNGLLEQVYLLSSDRLTLRAVDMAMGAVVGTLTLREPADAMAADLIGNKVLLASRSAREVRVVDAVRMEMVQTLFVDREPSLLAVDADGRYLLVGSQRTPGLAVYDLNTGTLLGAIDFPLPPREVAICSTSTDTAWAILPGGTLVKLDLPGHRVVSTIKLDGDLRGLAVSPDGTQVFVGDAASQRLLVRTAEGMGELALSFPPEAVLLDWRLNRVLVLDGGRTAEVDLETMRIVATHNTLPLAARPVLDPNSHSVFLPVIGGGVYRADWKEGEGRRNLPGGIVDEGPGIWRTIASRLHGFAEIRFEYTKFQNLKGPALRDEVRVGFSARPTRHLEYALDVGVTRLDSKIENRTIESTEFVHNHRLTVAPDSSSPLTIYGGRDAEDIINEYNGEQHIVTNRAGANWRAQWGRSLTTVLYGEVQRQHTDATFKSWDMNQDRYGGNVYARLDKQTSLIASYDHTTTEDTQNDTWSGERDFLDIKLDRYFRKGWQLSAEYNLQSQTWMDDMVNGTDWGILRFWKYGSGYDRTEFISEYHGSRSNDDVSRTFSNGGRWYKSWTPAFRTELEAFHLMDILPESGGPDIGGVGQGMASNDHGIYRWEWNNGRSWIEQSCGFSAFISPMPGEPERTLRPESITQGVWNFGGQWYLSGTIWPHFTLGERSGKQLASPGLDAVMRLEYRTRNGSWAGIENQVQYEQWLEQEYPRHFERAYADWRVIWRDLGWGVDELRVGGELGWDGTLLRQWGWAMYRISGRPSVRSRVSLMVRYDHRIPDGPSAEAGLDLAYRMGRMFFGLEGRWRPYGSESLPEEQYLMIRARRDW